MALVSCPECAAQVSDQAPACPQCGRPLGTSRVRTSEESFWMRSRGCGDIVLYGTLILLLLLILACRDCAA